MFNKYLIVASKTDKAGMNIASALSQFGNYSFYLVDSEITDESNLSSQKLSQFDFIIFASKHQSSSNSKTLSIHCPGNPSDAKLGGISNTFSMGSAIFNKTIFENLYRTLKEHPLKDYKVTLEATHHGPTIDKPCIFIEIGSTENEWRDKKAAFVLAKTIRDTIKSFQENPYREIAVGIGGPHYCPSFNKLQKNSNIAFAHIISKYELPLTTEILNESLQKTLEEVDFVVLDWKGLGNKESRDQVVEVLEKNYVQWKKSSKIN